VWVEFTANVKNGKLVEPIYIKKVERTNLAEEEARIKPYQKMWDNIRASWQWKLAGVIDNFNYKLQRYTVDNLKFASKMLRDHVKDKFKV
jgi:hypothetical protein